MSDSPTAAPSTAAHTPRVLSLESRRNEEMATLLRKQGSEPTVAASMQEVPLESCLEVQAFGQRLMAGEIDAAVFLTGVGAEALLARLELTWPRDDVLAALDRCRIYLRGPKPAAVLKRWGTHVDVRAPEPNTWEDLVRAIDDAGEALAGRTVAVQEYGTANLPLHEALRTRGAEVVSVPVYRWQMPDDTGPLSAAIDALIAGRFDLWMVTSAQQVRHLYQLAERQGRLGELEAAARRTPVASIGPTATETLREFGLQPVLEPAHPKMGPLAREAVAWVREANAK